VEGGESSKRGEYYHHQHWGGNMNKKSFVPKLFITCVVSIILATLFTSVVFAQSYESIKGIVLKDGSVIRGQIVEMNASIVRIRTADGSIQVRKFDDVQNFIKDGDTSSATGYSGYQSSGYQTNLTGAYLGIWGGYTVSPDATYERGPYSFDLDVQQTWAFGIKAGFTPPQAKYFSFELEFSYSNPDIDRSVFAQAGTDFISLDEANAKLYNYMFNIIAKYPEGKFHSYIGVGLGMSYVEVEGTLRARIGGTSITEYDSDNNTAFAWQILAGVDIELTNNLVLDLGYRYFYTKPEFEVTDIEYKTSMVTMGLKYYF